MRIAMMLLSLSLALTACKKKSEAPATGSGSSEMGMGSGSGSGSAMAGSAAAGSGSATGSAAAGGGSAGSGSDAAGSAAAGSGSGSADAVAMAHHAGMCPSTVFGATTKAELKDGKVMVTITSDDKDAIHSIQKRTEESLKEKTAGAPGTNAHDQKGTHGGGTGLCPVHVPEGATATAKSEAKGVMVTIAPKDPKDADALKTDIDGRIAKAADWVKANIKPGDAKNQGGDGGGSGDHGSNHSGKGNGSGKSDGTGGGGGKGKGSGSAKK